MERAQMNGHVQPRPAAAPQPVATAHRPMPADSGSKKAWVVGAIVLIAVLLLGGGAWFMQGMNNESSLVKSDKYQTVFLTNGQVYFGKIKSINKDYVTLTNIYYLQVQQTVQPTESKSNTNTDQASSTQLVKLGNELHGPEDSMQINRSQVLFWENIKDDGKVAQAIKSDTSKK